MKKTIISSAIATVLAATGLVATSAWASDREIYQRGGAGSAAVMISLDVSRTMREKFGTLDDGNGDYYGCVRSNKEEDITVGNQKHKFASEYCTYTDDTIKINKFFLRKKFPSYEEYIKQTCDFIPRNMAISGRENNIYKCYDRLTRAKIAMIGLLEGDVSRGISKLSDDKVIGLSVFPAYLVSTKKNDDHADKAAAVVVPAHRLDAQVKYQNKTITQREALVDGILNATDIKKSLWDKLTENDNVPIGSALAESAAYLMGTTTNAGFREMQKAWIKWDDRHVMETFSRTTSGLTNCSKHVTSVEGEWDEFGQCKWWLNPKLNAELDSYNDMYSRNEKNDAALTLDRGYFLVNDDEKFLKTSGHRYSNSEALNGLNYKAPEIITKQVKDSSLKSCHAQGVYIVTGGLSHIGDASQNQGSIDYYMKRMMSRSLEDTNYRSNMCKNGVLKDYTNVFGNENSTLDNSSWSCISAYADKLKNGVNPVGLSIKTAVVGVGKQFEELPSANMSMTTAQNEAELNTAIENLEAYEDGVTLNESKRTKHNLKNTALLGLYGGGGWYSAMSPQDIAESFNSFVNVISKDIPSASVNKSVIPVDILNPYELQPYAYLNMYEPTVQKATSAWAGNLKRYGIGNNGLVVDEDGNNIFAANGLVKDSVKDLWETSPLTESEKLKARIFQGGAVQQLELGKNDSNFKRKLYTTRDCKETDNNVTCEQDAKLAMKVVDNQYFNSSNLTSKDSLRGYLLALLGYDIRNPANINDADILQTWQQQPELRQMGAILHSDPILLTQQGTITKDKNGYMSTSNRDDYVLFGTTQGLLHVLDAKNGTEKFAFVPNEMVETNHKAFIHPEAVSSSTKFLYGIDGPWTVHTEYVAANQDNQALTVGQGANKDVIGKQWVYGGLRMGGRSYYALDLTDLEQPKVKFHIDPTQGKVHTPTGAWPSTTTESDAIKLMGQSWSKPVLTRVHWQGENKLVMIVGGGYDMYASDIGYEDPKYSQTSSATKIGAGVYMFDATTGKLLWWASSNPSTGDGITPDQNGVVTHKVDDMKYSVVSTIKTVDRDGDSLTDHLYFGDLGGQVWRVDFNNFRNKTTQPFATHIVRLLDLQANISSDNDKGKRPRFYTQPTFSIYRTPGSGRVMATISIGSGNASSPLHDSNNEPNWQANAIYTLFDKDVTRSNLYKMTTSQLKRDLKPTELSNNQRNGIDKALNETSDGWKFTFTEHAFHLDPKKTEGQKFYSTTMGAKVITDPVLMNNQLFVSVFDGAKSGTVQGCDAGIKGESVIERFCMPFGSCGSNSGMQNSLYAGVGIAPINISSAGQGTKNSRTIINSQCEGDSCSIAGSSSSVHSNNELNRKLRPMRWFERE